MDIVQRRRLIDRYRDGYAVVAAALALSTAARQAVPQASPTSLEALTVRITALASGPGNARVMRKAVVRTGAASPQGYSVLAWSTVPDPDSVPASSQPVPIR